MLWLMWLVEREKKKVVIGRPDDCWGSIGWLNENNNLSIKLRSEHNWRRKEEYSGVGGFILSYEATKEHS